MKTTFVPAMNAFALALTALVALGAESPEPLSLVEVVKIGAVDFPTKHPPFGLVVRDVLGLVTVSALEGQVVHRTTSRILESRATITPSGDYLLMFPEGDHYAKSKGQKMNTMLAYRSSDRGRTWQGPSVAFDIPYSQHGFIPFIPRGSKRIYAFGTQPIPGKWTWEDGQRENAPIGYRWSDDDGRTWSEVQLIAPVNDPDFKGMSVMRMTETDSGTWLLGSHLADWSLKPFTTQQYLLRSEDKGATWEVLPGARPNGWRAEGFDRMDEGRPLNLGGGRVLFMSRTPQGHLFTAWSGDDGKTWTKPAPSTLVHPDAPPMLFQLSDGKTLVAFHHNKVPWRGNGDIDDKAENMKVRSEIWVSSSIDEGHTWSEPRFLMVNAAQALHAVSGFNFQCSYLDVFVEDDILHIFMPHRWQQVLHLTIKESSLAMLPTQAELKQRAADPKSTSLFNGKDLSGWHVDVPYKDDHPDAELTFVVRNGMLVSLGQPRGHLITDESYENYRLEVEYRFASKPGNCGVLVYASTPRALNKMFPKSIEVQMNHQHAGDFWCIVEDITVPDMVKRRGPKEEWGVTEGKARRILNLTDDSEKPPGEWNNMVIECVGDAIQVWVNGDLVNHGTKCTATKGQIALQAEGSEVEFRKLELTPIVKPTL